MIPFPRRTKPRNRPWGANRARVRNVAAIASPSATPPRGPSRDRRWIAAAVAVAGGLLAVAGVLLGPRLAAHPAFAVRRVTVAGHEHVSEDALRSLAGIEIGSSWLSLNRRDVERRLESHPWVHRARVQRPWPGRVRLLVDEFEPVARVEIARRIYGICPGLQVVPAADEDLPLLRTRCRQAADPDALGRGLVYLASLKKAGLLERERVELELTDSNGDCLTLPDRGFAALIDGGVPAPVAVKNVASFLQKVDGEGGSRGTLRLVSTGTAVWRAAPGRASRAG